MPDSASSAVVVLPAIVSWTWVLTRWSGRPNTTATTMSAGASSRTTNSSVGLRVNRMITEPMRPIERREQARDGLREHRADERHVARQARDELAHPVGAVEVERERDEPAEQLAPKLGHDPLPHHAEQVGLEEARDRLHDEQDQQADDQPIEPGRVDRPRPGWWPARPPSSRSADSSACWSCSSCSRSPASSRRTCSAWWGRRVVAQLRGELFGRLITLSLNYSAPSIGGASSCRACQRDVPSSPPLSTQTHPRSPLVS